MKNTPDIIIEEFEARRTAEKDARRKKVFHRVYDVTQIAIALVVLSAGVAGGAASENKTYAIIIGAVLFAFLSREVQRRWAIENRLDELGKKKASN